ncbi:hypothetical protein HWV07_16230 [Natronomonas salina]|uniref:hypothetical protein n=1 Tax=Natronomonas salina TaxID=1710540 RepID=UPI0015B45913|nr:hypothetical protein HWV07_16230 [Natronomonas salina]
MGRDVGAERELVVADADQPFGLGPRYLAGQPVVDDPTAGGRQGIDGLAEQVERFRRHRLR